jgi:acid phosphatase (class A)
MKHFFGFTRALGVVCLTCITGHGQEQKADTAAKPAKVRVATYIDAERLPLETIVPPPPTRGSETAKAEFQELHRIQAARTPEQVKAARADDAEEDIFVYRTVLGPSFSAQLLPLTAAFSARLHGDEPIASNPLKDRYQRPRPYQVDSTLHPVCKVTTQHNAYPSGHSVSGYLLALTLAEMVPEKSAEILARADEYAHNRLVCGVHTASDLEASRLVAYAMFGSMMQEPRFQQDLQAARAETRHALGLSQ